MSKNVYPIFHGPSIVFVPGIPAVPHLGITNAEAEALVATGAFTYDEPDPPPSVTDQPTDPADAGSLDS